MSESELIQFATLHDLKCVIESLGSLADKKIAVAREYNIKTKHTVKKEAVPALLREPRSAFDGDVPLDEEDPADALL